MLARDGTSQGLAEARLSRARSAGRALAEQAPVWAEAVVPLSLVSGSQLSAEGSVRFL